MQHFANHGSTHLAQYQRAKQLLGGVNYLGRSERLQYQVTDRLLFMRFLGVALSGNVPNARTVLAFSEALKHHFLTEALFDRLNQALAELGIVL